MTTKKNRPAKGASTMSAAERDARVNLAACYRLAAHYGWTDLIYTHISARVPDAPDHYLLNPFGYLFDEITASSLVKVDLDGNKVDASPHRIHRAGFVIHSAIHAARPDAACVIHSHTRAGMAVSMMKCGLLPLSQHAMLFHGRVAYHDSEGFALDLDERQRLALDLGDKPVMLLRNHGTLVAGETVGQAFSMMWHLEKAMQAQVDALASGKKLTMPSEKVARAIAKRAFTNAKVEEYEEGQSPLGRLEWPALLRMLDRIDPSYRD
ncbi:MAG: class II aldolase/adducin family protein [Burkholderiales bacterium]|nr:class II aldolase/adducin family protein [Burkholderiales bacterium]